MAPANKSAAKRIISSTPSGKAVKKARITSKNSNNISNMSSVASSPFNFGGPSANSAVVTVDVLKSLLSETVASVNKNIDEKFLNMNEVLLNQNKKIIALESEVQQLKSSVVQVSTENEYLWKEVLRPNLILAGIQDSENENKQMLSQQVSKLLIFNGSQIKFDSVFRIGNYSTGRNRPIKIKFNNTSDREFVFENRAKFKAPIFINEDLPRITRRDHAVLRQTKRKMIAEGSDPKNVKINWIRKSINCGSSLFILENGNMKLASRAKQHQSQVSSKPSVIQSNQQADFLATEMDN